MVAIGCKSQLCVYITRFASIEGSTRGEKLEFHFLSGKTEAVPRKLTEIAGKQVSEIQAALDLDKI